MLPGSDEGDLSLRPDRIVIAIPTFRRLDLLTLLLDGLIPQAAAAGAAIIVGDNACEQKVADRIEKFSHSADISYLQVPERGLSQVRNSLIAEANRLHSGWRWLLMLDDDGQVTPGWLEKLVACGVRYDADLVGGPIIGSLPAGSGVLARNSIFAARQRSSTGIVDMLITTQNLGISSTLMSKLQLPLFQQHLGASGGEDYDLFRRTRQAGGVLAWCDEAQVIEPAPAERLTPAALLRRYYTSGVYVAKIDASYDGWQKGAAIAARGLVGSAARCVIGLLTLRNDYAARGLLDFTFRIGLVAGLVGARSSRYVA